MLTITTPVQVKVILTEASRALLLAEYRRQVRQLQQELEQWQFQGKKLLSEAKKQSDGSQLVRERVAREERVRKEKLELLQFQIKQVENLPEGSEIYHTTVESSIEIKVGERWDEIMEGTEIILKDGVIHEIRRGVKPT
ncbi:YlqD family protein [Brevibacillus massiliensis]|jgi:flagellin-like hook-associated protein FlgL|uniref:YlqD family protein n=1 Tax=Brevibacillus massiliensis TaxID=1118054 RepID=UPI0002D49D84|nr:YlqD family protein [Brevibacillus massiliensis]